MPLAATRLHPTRRAGRIVVLPRGAAEVVFARRQRARPTLMAGNNPGANMRTFRLVLLALLLISACTSGLKRPVNEVTAKTDPQGVQRVTLETHSFYFEPNRIVVKANIPVELK